mmetsp:Transcript_145024/g.403965  ORF Transcript_145024/g.403965 Transcript_145024/m.403965 type:complete len:227 (-) Transcript_145024:364-1044(-)
MSFSFSAGTSYCCVKLPSACLWNPLSLHGYDNPSHRVQTGCRTSCCLPYRPYSAPTGASPPSQPVWRFAFEGSAAGHCKAEAPDQGDRLLLLADPLPDAWVHLQSSRHAECISHKQQHALELSLVSGRSTARCCNPWAPQTMHRTSLLTQGSAPSRLALRAPLHFFSPLATSEEFAFSGYSHSPWLAHLTASSCSPLSLVLVQVSLLLPLMLCRVQESYAPPASPL